MREAPDQALFACSGIDLTLGGRKILSGVSLEAHAARILGVIGPNGAGKTSLFEVLSGRIFQDAGTVVLDGRDISRMKIQKRLKAGIGRTYQSPVVPNSLTVSQVLRAARKAFFPMLSYHRAEWAANIMRFRVPGNTVAGALDTLDRRKLLMTCLLMRRPRVLLLDEPASGLIDAELEELDQILRLLAQEMKICILLVEHRLELLDAVADDVVVLDLGKRIASGPPETVFDHPDVQAAYFETPDDVETVAA